MSTAEILESLNLEKIDDPNYYLYPDESDEAKLKSKEYSTSSNSELKKKNRNGNYNHTIESHKSSVSHSCHKRACEQSLVQIKNSLPRYNRQILFTRKVSNLNIKIVLLL